MAIFQPIRIIKICTSTRFVTKTTSDSPKALYKFLIRQCNKLPKAPREHYKFQIKQSFKQHINEIDPIRINEIIKRSYEDATYVINKYLGSDKK